MAVSDPSRPCREPPLRSINTPLARRAEIDVSGPLGLPTRGTAAGPATGPSGSVIGRSRSLDHRIIGFRPALVIPRRR